MSDSHCAVFIATSVDGFIARENGAIDWLMKPEFDEQEGLPVTYQDFVAEIDALVMGRHTFETVLGFGGDWPYELPVVVLSGKGEAVVPPELRERVLVEQGEPAAVVERLAERGWTRLYIDGGNTVRRFLAAGLIREMTITRIPVLLGTGIPLFGPLDADVELEAVETGATAGGLVQTRYRVR